MSKFPFAVFSWVTVFAVAMGFLETSVVVYLRALLYPGGFTFPLTYMPESLALVEILREAATIIMLLGVGVLAGKQLPSKFAWFIYAFAVWDIFYYVFLKIFLNWPESMMTWDILFLIPLSWVGPVITPVIVSLTMIFFAILIIYYESVKQKIMIAPYEWILLITGSLILIVGFIWDYSSYILQHYSLSQLLNLPKEELYKMIYSFVPRTFNWLLFWMGESVIAAGILLFWRRNNRLD